MLHISVPVFSKKSRFPFKAGDKVTFDGKVAEVISIGTSPYYDEEIKGIRRAYVSALDGSWTAYWPLQDGLEAR